MLQFIRRTIQIFGVIFIIVVPILSLYGVLASNFRLMMVEGRGWQKVFELIDNWLRLFSDDPARIASDIKGTLFWSLTIKGFNLSDPLTFLGNLFGARQFYLSLLLSVLSLIVITALLGRVYCGWVCPMNLVFELNCKLRRLFYRLGLRPFNIEFNRLHKYNLLIVGAILSFILGIQVLSFLYPPILLNREVIHLIYFGSIGMGGVFLVLVLFIELSLSQRAWCRYFCPGGALWSLLGARRVVRITLDRELCDDCGKCDLACEFGLSPMRGRMGMECDNCGKCKSRCDRGALRYTLVYPWQGWGKGKERKEKELRLVSN